MTLFLGLFHRGFSHSGTVLNAWALQDVPVKKFQIFSEYLGCSGFSTKKVVDCLKSRPIKQVIEAQQKFKPFDLHPVAPFGPVVENHTKTPFLKDHPYNLLVKGHMSAAPWINLFTANDFAFVTSCKSL